RGARAYAGSGIGHDEERPPRARARRRHVRSRVGVRLEAAVPDRDRPPARRPLRLGLRPAGEEADAPRAHDERAGAARGRGPARPPRAPAREPRAPRLGRARRGDGTARRAARPPPPRRSAPLRKLRAPLVAARALSVRRGACAPRGPVRARAGGGAASGRRGAPRLSAPRRARPSLLRDGSALARRPPAAPAPPARLRAAQRARVRARRVAAQGALALYGASRPADGQGPRGLAARRGRGAPRRRRERG